MDTDSNTTVDEGATPATIAGPRWLVPVLVVVLGLALATGAFGLGNVAADDAPTSPAEGSVDVGFSRDMVAHHVQAVEMAGVVRDNTTDEDVWILAFDIETAQLSQVGQMRGWLQSWGRGPNRSGDVMAWMGGTGHEHGGLDDSVLMPGMATSEEMDRLRTLRGNELDVFFLQLMIRHHQGGLPMARYAADHAAEEFVRATAQKMVDAQAAEIVTMERMLRDRGGVPLPPPA